MKRFIYGKLDRGAMEPSSHLSEREGEIMLIARRDVVTVSPTMSIKNVASTMVEYKTRRVPITHPGTNIMEGIVVTRDIVDFLGGGDKYQIISKKNKGNFIAAINEEIREIMSHQVFFIEHTETIERTVEFMRNNDVGGFPILRKGKVVGIVEERDIALHLAGEKSGYFVEDIMTRNLITIPPGTTLEDASRFMIRNSVRRLPVIQEGNLVGLVTTTDILRFFATNEIFRMPAEDPLSSRLSTFMTKKVVTITPRTDLGEAAQLMKKKNVGCLPVIDEQLVGIVTERDMLKTF